MAKLRKVLKKKPARSKKVTLKKSIKRRPALKTKRAKKPAKVIVASGIVINQVKFSSVPEVARRQEKPQDLPSGYARERIVLQVRDPRWLYSYWQVLGSTWDRLKQELKGDFFTAKPCLRVYDVSSINFDGTNSHRFFDIEVTPDARSWYIDTQGPGRSWCVDFGLKLSDGRFVTILRSNIVSTPLDGPSWLTDEEWMLPDDTFAKLYRLGFGQSSPVGKGWSKKVFFSGAFASGGMGSMSSPGKKKK